VQTIHKQALQNLGCLVLAYLNKQASISCLLALLPLFATQGKQAIARDRRQDKKAVLPF
jgi:hypothetical protein